MKKSYKQLEQLAKAISQILKSGESFNKKLIFTLNKNLIKIKNKFDEISDDLQVLPEKFNDYQTDVSNIAIEAGGEGFEGGVNINTKQFDNDKFTEAVHKINTQYSKTLEDVKRIKQHNDEVLSQQTEIELETIKLDWFPEIMTADKMPTEMMELIEQ